MKELCLDGIWNAVFYKHRDVVEHEIRYTEASQVKNDPRGIKGTVPGNFELDLHANGLIPDPYYGDNILKIQDYEDTHWWYATTFSVEDPAYGKTTIRFDGIDTLADIYLNGVLVASTDNMLISHEFDISGVVQKENSLVVHLKPVCIIAREYQPNAGSFAHKYWYDGLRIRKAVHMFGWDIMPRAVSAGIWKSVYIKQWTLPHISEFYIFPQDSCDISKSVTLSFLFNVRIDERENIRDYAIEVSGVCGDSVFYEKQALWSTGGKYRITLEKPKLWYPAGRGAQDMYQVQARLLRHGEVMDTYDTRLGIRSVELRRSSLTDASGNGEFCFIVNGEKVFVMGTNWVPLDAFHSRDHLRLERALQMLPELHCNMVRCWGGNVYEDHAFFDFCDENGIMVWQDFSMACAIYPQDDAFSEKIYNEASHVIRKLRQHPSLVLWAGDNECDLVYERWTGIRRDPNNNRLTRSILPRAIADHDPTRPYLPSSPYIDSHAFAHGGIDLLPENHLWGARSYYKNRYYKDAVAHFASEQGYMGCPSPRSLKRFLSPACLWPYSNDEWRLHGAAPETQDSEPYGNDSPFAFRTKVMADEIKELFGVIPDDLERFALASQIVQAEAMKFFVELFRIGKWRRTGIIWWNLLDGWPQISEAVVDYYFCRKQAFYAIQMSQQPVCLMFGEPGDWGLELYGVNDTKDTVAVSYSIRDAMDRQCEVLSGSAVLAPDSSASIDFVSFCASEKALYIIEWYYPGGSGLNYYLAGNPRFDIDMTISAFLRSGLFKAEGFEFDKG